MALTTILACGGGGNPLLASDFLSEYAWATGDWSWNDSLHGTGSVTRNAAVAGTTPPVADYALNVFPAGDNVSEVWAVGRMTTATVTPTLPYDHLLVNFNDRRISVSADSVEITVVLHQGGKVYVCNRRHNPTAAWGSASWSNVRDTEFEEYDNTTHTFNATSHPSFVSGGMQMGLYVHARRANPASMTEAVQVDNLVISFVPN